MTSPFNVMLKTKKNIWGDQKLTYRFEVWDGVWKWLVINIYFVLILDMLDFMAIFSKKIDFLNFGGKN